MDIERLNININGKSSVGFTGSDAMFKTIETLIEGVVPKSFVEFVKQVDGGHPEIGCCPLQGDDLANAIDVDWFYSVDNSAVETVQAAIAGWGTVLGKRILPIGRDGVGNQIYIDLNASSESIWVYLHDQNGARVKLANNLEQFLDKLISNPDFI